MKIFKFLSARYSVVLFIYFIICRHDSHLEMRTLNFLKLNEDTYNTFLYVTNVAWFKYSDTLVSLHLNHVCTCVAL